MDSGILFSVSYREWTEGANVDVGRPVEGYAIVQKREVKDLN